MKASENRHYKVLELDKVLHRLAELTTCEDAKWEAERILPCTTLVEAQALLNQTEAAYLLLAKFGGPSFGSMKNVNNALFRASAGGALTMKELLDIAEDLRVIRSVSEWRFRQPGADSCLDILFGALMPQRLLEETIVTSIVSEEEMSDRASPALADIRRKMRQQAQHIRDKLDGMVHSAHYKQYLQDAIITQRNGRFVVPVKNEFRGNVPGLVHDTSGSGSTVFIEPMAVVEANNEIRVLQGKEREEIDRILSELSAQAGEVADTVKHSYECLVELNLIFAKARLAYDMNASVPVLNEDGITVTAINDEYVMDFETTGNLLLGYLPEGYDVDYIENARAANRAARLSGFSSFFLLLDEDDQEWFDEILALEKECLKAYDEMCKGTPDWEKLCNDLNEELDDVDISGFITEILAPSFRSAAKQVRSADDVNYQNAPIYLESDYQDLLQGGLINEDGETVDDTDASTEEKGE